MTALALAAVDLFPRRPLARRAGLRNMPNRNVRYGLPG